MRISRVFSDVTVGTLIVMIHAARAQRLSGAGGGSSADAAPVRHRDPHPESSHRRATDRRAYVHPR